MLLQLVLPEYNSNSSISMKKILYLFVALFIGFTACSKKDMASDDALPERENSPKGGFSGIVFPFASVRKVNAISLSGTDSTNAVPDSLGNFKLAGLKAGTYNLRFDMNAGFLTKENLRASITAGTNTDLGKLVFAISDSANLGSISGKITPANSVETVRVTDIHGNTKYSAIPDQDGNYLIAKINPGYYLVTCVSAVGYTPPATVTCTVNPTVNTALDTLTSTPASVVKKAIDTIGGLYSIGTLQEINNFITRAAADSAIVFSESFYLSNSTMTPELASALDKIIAVKSVLTFSHTSTTAASFKNLTEIGQFRLIAASNLKSLNLSALQKLNGLELRNCPALSTVDLGALKQLSGDLKLENTGFRDLGLFSKISYSAFDIDISNNQQLTTLKGLNFARDSLYGCRIFSNVLLANLSGLEGLKRFKGETVIYDNALVSLAGLDNIVSAKRLTIMNNRQLREICPAKKMLVFLRDTPDYLEYYYDRNNRKQVRTITALVASGNGMFLTLEELKKEIGNCP